MTDLDRLLELAEKKGEKGLWTNEYPELREKIRLELEENKEEIRQLKYRLADEQDSSHKDCRKKIRLLKSQIVRYQRGNA